MRCDCASSEVAVSSASRSPVTAPDLVTELPGPKARAHVAFDETWTSPSLPAGLPDRAGPRRGPDGRGHRRQPLPRLRGRDRGQLDRPRPSAGRRGDQGAGRRAASTSRASDFYLPIYAEVCRERIARIAPIAGPGPGLPRQLRDRGRRGVDQARPLRHQAAVHRRLPRRVPRPDLRLGQPDRVEGEVPRRVRAAAAGRLPRAVRQGRGPALVRRGPVRQARPGRTRSRRSSSSRSRARAATSSPRTASSQGLRAICDQHGILLVADEIQSGAGRTGKMWAVEHWGVEPDILLTAKGIASGMPLGAMVARAELLEAWGPGAHGSTYGGNPVACAAALATIELLEGGLVDNARGPRRAGPGRPAAARATGMPGARPRRPRPGPDDRHRVRHRRARRGGPVGGLPARPARPRVRQVERSGCRRP